MTLSLLLHLLTLFLSTAPLSSHPTHLTKSLPLLHTTTRPHPYFELTPPLPTTFLTPTCTLPILTNHLFANTINHPPLSLLYTPPHHCNWSHAILDFRASSKGEQYDRIAGLWLNGVELLRTSTAEPNDDGIFWNIQKDVTKYYSLLTQSNLSFSIMLENVVNDVFTGVYDVSIRFLYYSQNINVNDDNNNNKPLLYKNQNLKLEFESDEFAKNHLILGADSEYNRRNYSLNLYGNGVVSNPLSQLKQQRNLNRKFGFGSSDEFAKKPLILYGKSTDYEYNLGNSMNLYKKPADLVIPVSGDEEKGFWFRIESESDMHSREIQIPPNTYKAVIEIYVSFHGNDEFWYSNPPDSYIEKNNLTTGRGHGAYREILVTIDGDLVGSVVPFPVIFTGGINPLFWEPMVAIGAFNLPTYDLDLTAFLGKLIRGKSHVLGLGVADGISFWFVDANLHLWLDHESSRVQAEVGGEQEHRFSITRHMRFKELDGKFVIEAQRNSRVSGWVNSSMGNLTTYFSEEIRFKNSIKFKKYGTQKLVEQKVKAKTRVRIQTSEGIVIARSNVRRTYPLTINISTLPGSESEVNLMFTKVDHGLREKKSSGKFWNTLSNSQQSSGWMAVKDQSVIDGSASTNQIYDYKDGSGRCYSRMVSAANGKLLNDTTSIACPSSF